MVLASSVQGEIVGKRTCKELMIAKDQTTVIKQLFPTINNNGIKRVLW
jgi:hypothetical protein